MSDEDEYANDMKETDPNFYKGIGKRVKTSPPIDFTEWNLFDEEEIAALFKALMRKGFEHATEHYVCHAWFATDRDTDFDIDNPTDIVVELPIGATEDDSPAWIFSLTDMVKEMIEWNEHGKGGQIDEEYRPQFVLIRDDLRRLANLLDAALARKPK